MKQQLNDITSLFLLIIMIVCSIFCIIKSESRMVVFALFGMPLLYLILYTTFEDQLKEGKSIFLALAMYFMAITILVAF